MIKCNKKNNKLGQAYRDLQDRKLGCGLKNKKISVCLSFEKLPPG